MHDKFKNITVNILTLMRRTVIYLEYLPANVKQLIIHIK